MSQKRIFTDDEKKIIVDMYKEGETYQKIAKLLHTKQDKVSKVLKEFGYGIRARNTLKYHDYLSASRKRKLNENYFEKIDTQSKAYWLGFLYADGYVCKRHDKNGNDKGGSLELTLKSEDAYHIDNFLKDINSDAPIAQRIVKLDEKTYTASRAIVSSIKIVKDLINHGCTERKSLTLCKPDIDKELIPHFIRGYFDGDGCVIFFLNLIPILIAL